MATQSAKQELLSHGDDLISSDELAKQLADVNSRLAIAISQLASKQGKIEVQNSELANLQQLVSSLELTIAFQRKKLRALESDNERIGADLEILKSLERRLVHISPNPHAALAELLSWQHLGMSRLAPTVPVANEQLDALWNYVREMSSPGHRIVSFLGKALSMTWVGRKIRAAIHFLYLLGNTKQ